MQSNNSIETFAFGTSEGLKVTTPQNNAKYGYLWRSHKRKHKKSYSKLATNSYHLYRTVIIGGSGSGKTNSLFN